MNIQKPEYVTDLWLHRNETLILLIYYYNKLFYFFNLMKKKINGKKINKTVEPTKTTC